MGLTKNLVFLSMSFSGDDLLDRPSSMTASLSVLCLTSGECCVETTMASTAHRHVVLVLDRDLGLAVGPEKVDLARLAHVGEALGELVRVGDGRRHELGGLVGRVAEHEALVAGALLLVEAFALGHALRDVGRLLLDGGEHARRSRSRSPSSSRCSRCP